MKLKYFGTDGVRGVANRDLSPELAFRVGRAGGYVLTRHSQRKRPQVLVSRDTRISGEMLENALVAGLLSVGIEVFRLGVVTTPGVAYLVRAQEAANFFDNEGRKEGIRQFIDEKSYKPGLEAYRLKR